ncbi:trigger factor [Chloroflexota bacterium]
MKVTNEKTENSQAFLTIEMEPAEVEESLESSYRRLVKRTRIPGFRKGKAPREVLERYIGKESLFEEALNNLVPQAYEKAVTEQAIEAIAQPQIEVTQTDPLVFKAIVPLKPTVKLGDYRPIQVTMEPIAVTEDEVSSVIEQLRRQHATWEPVGHAVDFSDLVVFDIESSVEDKPLINQKGAQYLVTHDQSSPILGFAEQLVGMKSNEEKEFKLQLPSDYPRSELAEKEASFKIKITEIKQEVLPELNDEFAKEVNADFKTLDSLREQALSDLKLRAEEKARIDFEERVIDAVVDLTEVEFPTILVEAETHRILAQRFQKGNQELEEYLRSINKTEEELHEELRPLATKRVTRSIVLGKVIEEEKIEVNDSEIDNEIENMAKSATENKDELEKALNTPQVRESIGQTLLTRKTVQRLTDIAKSPQKTKRTRKKEAK